MLRKILKSKLHRAVVTGSDLNYEGSIAIDEALIEGAELLPNEPVHVWNITNGEHLETYAISAARGSGEICLNGAAARLAHQGDVVIISSFCWLEEEEARHHLPKMVRQPRAGRESLEETRHASPWRMLGLANNAAAEVQAILGGVLSLF